MVKKRSNGYVLQTKGLPTLRIRKNVELPEASDLKAITITRCGRRLWVNLTYCVESKALHPSNLAVGLDMEIADRITLSTGEAILGQAKREARACPEASISM